jgi:hypothetical protein
VIGIEVRKTFKKVLGNFFSGHAVYSAAEGFL